MQKNDKKELNVVSISIVKFKKKNKFFGKMNNFKNAIITLLDRLVP